MTTRRSHLFAVIAAIVLNMVNTQDERLINPTPSTAVTAISLNGRML
jgi:hypothetical protein